ncbi:polyamine aminopropyltransferase [Aureispira anguillae]|uniref:Polyamine aminopropyltransferase n=1 Tax=Aureispira anguillae TaxID=2864201 RepID=A0A915YHP4_9BACT|nr:polyamine aminopropyltransferase [Aureispira anguillae]BDS13207.1 polyamine aminopropyltransferase [Aureispira anguillae]
MKNKKSSSSFILMTALFATGLSGIVAEYVLATLATYFLGDSVFQWTIVLSLMLFSMGLGSRLSKSLEKNLLEAFIFIELLLSILISLCALITYLIMPYTNSIWLVMYLMAVVIGLLIGMEIPLVTRINDNYKSLRANISGVMEKDYYGSLFGGLFFAFIGIRYLGLTYTPFVVGGINFLVALLLFYYLRNAIANRQRNQLQLGFVLTAALLGLGLFLAEPIVLYGEQSRYREKVVFTKQTPYQKITVTQWQGDYWLYLNTGKQLSTFDEWMYHEPLVHPAMKLAQSHKKILIMGAGDGCAIREVLKYPDVDSIILVDLDPEMTNIGQHHPIFKQLNQSAYFSPKLRVVNADAFNYLEATKAFYDVIIADFPDPKSVEINRLYTREFYQICKKRLRPHGVFITQAASPYYTTKAFRTIEKTIAAAGFQVVPIHNHIYTFGEWGWVIGMKEPPAASIKKQLQTLTFEDVDVRWINRESMLMMTSFGRDLVKVDRAALEINTIHNPVLYRCYAEGNWSYYF